ncbi:unnamed protein product [Cylicocyclus nassatus]|uniref:Uncharacterized protein n=1 Tax=Cylicocyclus nassatus TaxID=53992 RepID=A0AA36GVQ0_CYLNA|nr:unnamed protein product [Cylicocyclus nassatus]
MYRNDGQGWPESMAQSESGPNRNQSESGPTISPVRHESTDDGANWRKGIAYKLPWAALFLFVVIFGAALTVILTVALTSKQPKGNDELRVMHFSMYKGDMGDEEVKVPPPRLHLVLRAKRDIEEKCSLKKNVKNTDKAISEIVKNKPSQQYNFILYGDYIEEIGPLKSLDAINALKSITPKRQNNTGFNQADAIKTFLSKTDRKKDILVHYAPCNFTYSADDPDMKALAEIVKTETGLSKKFSFVSNTKNSSEVEKTFKAFNITEDVMKKIVIIGSDKDIAEEIKEEG